uniref:Uncharacterized protein n=1 Tax=Chromera velia CCMP2878 TaxID=1169474 RepID=A0A0G4IDB5_9ALVE|eukprot:Cvel_13365.t1-p1 / transcript=Cvel_13365.t1 / gene=Cvel_13365 / organism=Chromera_velia_CCMP2878 / gene_product=Ankyrin repeat domain-containing protein 50, putative / transcript_product=Ankyrin repeat domain-containing protein 50, putative / location=Cvel_scaffold909:17270-19192(-) / protein_length=641 / sequence_SO=supercontig / SO=protein_coding / is_pseudo=false
MTVTALSPHLCELTPLILRHVRRFRPVDFVCLKAAVERLVEEGKAEDLLLLLRLGADVNEVFEETPSLFEGSSTPPGSVLHYAAERGSVEGVRILLNLGAFVDLKSGKGWTALHVASFHARPKVVRFLLKQKADKDMTTTERKSGIFGTVKRKTALMLACENKSKQAWLTVFEVLVEGKADVNIVDGDGRTALTYASECGSVEVVKLLLTHAADVNSRDKERQTVLLWGVRSGVPEVVRLLLEGGTKTDVLERGGWETELICASAKGFTDVVKVLLGGGANVNGLNRFGETALMHACMKGNEEVVRVLLEHRGGKWGRGKADVHAKDEEGKTTLMLVTRNRKDEMPVSVYASIVKALLKAKANMNAADGSGRTALMFASMLGDAEAAEVLIGLGAKVNCQDTDEGWSALMHACVKGDSHVGCVQTLLQGKADVNQTNSEGYSALSLAAFHLSFPIKLRGQTGVFEALIEGKADVNLASQNRATPLMHVAGWGNTKGVQLFIKARAELNAVECSHKTALCLASMNGNDAAVSMLLEAGAKVDIPDEEGITALIWASFQGHTRIVRALIKAKADIEAVNKEGKTALIYASSNRKDQTVEALVEAKANVEAVDKEKGTALTYATEKGHSKVVELIQNELKRLTD